jgi:pyruvate formate lyase activating enzyme
MMNIRIFQKGFHFSQDGPGNRLVYHLQGCQMRCPWCSNPEGLAAAGGTEVAVADMIDEAVRSRVLYVDGGGVTLTGGEATLQMDAVLELLAGLKAQGIHTALETNGLSPRLPELIPLVDCWMIDCKHYDDPLHQAVLNQSNEPVIRNICRVARDGKTPDIRIPLINGFNAGEREAAGFAGWFASFELQNRIRIELLPYHDYGKIKYEKLGMDYTMTKDAFVPEDIQRRMEDVFQTYGFTCIRT